MKVFAITLALAASAAAAPLSAQIARQGVVLSPVQQSGTNCSYTRSNNTVGDIIFGRTNASACRDVYSREDGAWYQIGRGNTYERRVRDQYGNLVIQHARRNRNGTFTILNSRSAVNDKRWRKEEQKAMKQEQKQEQKAVKQQEKVDDKMMKERVKSGAITKSQYDTWKKSGKGRNK